jgi:hypothetical protein
MFQIIFPIIFSVYGTWDIYFSDYVGIFYIIVSIISDYVMVSAPGKWECADSNSRPNPE